MNYIGKFLSNFKEFYNEINTATLTGAIDVVVAQQEDGSFISSPFHVRFGKIGVLKSKEKIVDIEINGRPVDIHMKLGESGEAFFVQPVGEGEELSSAELATSPLPRPLPSRPRLPAEEDAPRLVDGRQLDSSEPFSLQGAAAELTAGAAIVGTPVNAHLSVAQLDCDLPAPPPDEPQTPGAHAHMTVTNLSCDVVPAPGSQAADAHAHVTVTDVTTVCDEPGAAAHSTVTTDMSCEVRPRPGDSPVTFKARKVEKLVKLDGSTMFVPIKNTEKVTAGTQTERALIPAGSAGAPAEERSSPEDREPVKKRKSKKRKTAKQHRRSLSETKLEPAQEEEIFQMEDVKQEVRASRASLDDWTSRLSNCPQDCHPFSDTDISPRGSRHSSRAATPIKSDTEFEIERERLVSDEGSQTDTTVWQWGELPSPSRSSAPPPPGGAETETAGGAAATDPAAAADAAATTAASEERSMLSGMFSFMRKTKKARHDPVAEGIYLDDLNLESLDPEVAALYFPRSQALAGGDKEAAVDSGADHCLDDDEGNGSSIPHSPSPSSPHSCDHHRPLELELGDVAMSLCGGLEGCFDGSVPESLFLQCLVTYDELCDEPRLLERPELVVRINGRYYNWASAAPLICSQVMFRRPLPSRTLERLAEQTMPKKKPAKKGSGRSYSWWSWRRSGEAAPSENEPEPDAAQDAAQEAVRAESARTAAATASAAAAIVTAAAAKTVSSAAARAAESSTSTTESQTHPTITEVTEEMTESDQAEAESHLTPTAEPLVVEPFSSDDDALVVEPLSGEALVEAAEEAVGGVVAPGPHREEETRQGLEPADLTALTAECETQTGTPPGSPGRPLWQTDASSDSADRQRHSESDDTAEEEFGTGAGSGGERLFKKTLRLSSEMIAKLGLHEGQNEALFSVTTAYQGTSRCKCNIFLWRYDDKIVVSDIDGTITKSDVLGHILPIVGQHWAQSGVAALYSKIRDNGYKFLYLSARAIGQAPITREYLKSVRQGDLSLPDGPLLLSPSSLVSALHREVIERRPEDFKIPCLRDIQALFPGRNPLYAGYGNRVNDAFAYRAVGIPSSRIFTINHRGELRHELTQTFQSSYTNLTHIVDHFFPPCVDRNNDVANNDYNSFVYWRDPIPELTELAQL